MAGGHSKVRHLSRKSSHRVALLRNLVTSLFEHERIQTTWHKAKEAQRVADKLVTLAKRNTEASKRRAWSIFFRPHELVPKLFSDIRLRYLTRPGGYTRVLHIEPLKDDQAASAILELVDSPKDTRFTHTALTIARMRSEGFPMNEPTSMNITKVTQFRENGKEQLEELVQEFEELGDDPVATMLDGAEPVKRKAGVARQVRLGRRIVRIEGPGSYNRKEKRREWIRERTERMEKKREYVNT